MLTLMLILVSAEATLKSHLPKTWFLPFWIGIKSLVYCLLTKFCCWTR